jgi:hypothetical protein
MILREEAHHHLFRLPLLEKSFLPFLLLYSFKYETKKQQQQQKKLALPAGQRHR